MPCLPCTCAPLSLSPAAACIASVRCVSQGLHGPCPSPPALRPLQPQLMSELERMEGMKGVVHASDQLRNAANELLPRLLALCGQLPVDDFGFETRASGTAGRLEPFRITEPRIKVSGPRVARRRPGFRAVCASDVELLLERVPLVWDGPACASKQSCHADMPCKASPAMWPPTARLRETKTLPLPRFGSCCSSEITTSRRFQSWRIPPSCTQRCCQTRLPPLMMCEVRSGPEGSSTKRG